MYFAPYFLARSERVERSQRADFQRFNAVLHVVHGAGRRGEMKNVIHAAHVIGLIHVLLHKLKARLILQVVNVAQAAGKQIVHAHNVIAFRQQRIAQMRPHKSRSARHQYPHRRFSLSSNLSSCLLERADRKSKDKQKSALVQPFYRSPAPCCSLLLPPQ